MKFNEKKDDPLVQRNDAKVMRAGGIGYEMSPHTKLVQLVATNLFGEPRYYGDVKKELNDTIVRVAEEDPEFILKLAAYTRNELYLRTISTYLLDVAANLPYLKGTGKAREYTSKVLRRADGLTEIIACQTQVFPDEPIPNSLKKGINDTWQRFDEYQFAKYNRTGKGRVTFRNVMDLTHPHPDMFQDPKLPKKILEVEEDGKQWELKIPYTWEVEISRRGNKAEVWEDLIDSGRFPYMAMLRNLRNLLDADISKEHIQKVCDIISNPKQVKRSRQLPFRFLAAYKAIQDNDNAYTSLVLDAISEALDISFENIPYQYGTTVIAGDNSGSMQGRTVSRNSSIYAIDIASVFAAGVHKFCEYPLTAVFGDTYQFINLPKSGNTLQNAQVVRNTNVGHMTHGYLILKHCLENNVEADRFIVFTDEQMYTKGYNRDIQHYWKMYQSQVNPNAKLFVVNLVGYGETKFPENDNSVVEICGWSDKIFKFIDTIENDQVKYIQENY